MKHVVDATREAKGPPKEKHPAMNRVFTEPRTVVSGLIVKLELGQFF
jgi:hypothetical protein